MALLAGLVAPVAGSLASPAGAATAPAWAGSSFCTSFSGGYYLGNSYDGVAACGGPLSGVIQYKSVPFDTAGWNCVELTARYLYATTGKVPPAVPKAKNVAQQYHATYTQYPVYPTSGGTSVFSPSIAPGDIISMWGGAAAQSAGHVAIVYSVNVSGGKGTITLLDENGNGLGGSSNHGFASINVSNGQMSFGSPSFDSGKFYYTSFQWLSMAPPQTLPAQPGSLKGLMSSTSAALTWTETSNNVGSFVSQYRTGSGSWKAGSSVGANARSLTVTGLKPSTTYTFQVGARNAVGTHWSAYYTGKTAAQPTQTAPPPAYHTGRQVKIAPNATTGVSGHLGPNNTYASNKATGANQPLWIVCYVTGQSITNSYYEDTTTMWDLSDDGYYYSDAWLYTGTNGAAVPTCHLKPVSVDKYATGGLSGHTGPGNNYTAGPLHGANTPITIACYVTGQSITNSHYEDTTTIWDLAVGGYYYSDAWLYTGTNGAAVPHC